MSVTRAGTTIVMTADADAIASTAQSPKVFWIKGITFQLTGGTAGQRLRLTDTAGDLIVDYMTEAATDNADLWNARKPHFYQGLLVEDFPAGGTGVLTIFLE
jgi:hypothetical protein